MSIALATTNSNVISASSHRIPSSLCIWGCVYFQITQGVPEVFDSVVWDHEELSLPQRLLQPCKPSPAPLLLSPPSGPFLSLQFLPSALCPCDPCICLFTAEAGLRLWKGPLLQHWGQWPWPPAEANCHLELGSDKNNHKEIHFNI